MTETPQHPVFAEDRVARWLGAALEEAGPDRARLRMTLADDHLNGLGTAHGGVVFALADACFAVACNDVSAQDSMTVASGVDITYLAPARAGDVLVAEGRLVARAGRSGLYDITVTRDDGTLVAAFRGRSRTVPAR